MVLSFVLAAFWIVFPRVRGYLRHSGIDYGKKYFFSRVEIELVTRLKSVDFRSFTKSDSFKRMILRFIISSFHFLSIFRSSIAKFGI